MHYICAMCYHFPSILCCSKDSHQHFIKERKSWVLRRPIVSAEFCLRCVPCTFIAEDAPLLALKELIFVIYSRECIYRYFDEGIGVGVGVGERTHTDILY